MHLLCTPPGAPGAGLAVGNVCGNRLSDGHAAIHRQNLTGNVIRQGRGKKKHGIGHILGLAQACPLKGSTLGVTYGGQTP